MTLNELKTDTAALGFEKEIELDESFIGAVNRALGQIFTERRQRRIMRIFPRELSLSFFRKAIIHRGGEKSTLKATGRAFAFSSFGEGTLTVEDGFGTREYHFSGEGTLTRGFIKGEARFSFGGEFSYTVSELTVYSELKSEDIKDVLPLSLAECFDATSYDGRFLYFCSAPFDDSGSIVNECEIKKDKVYLRAPLRSAINIEYTVKAPRLSLDSVDEEIELPDGTEHLLPLLCAHYVWLDDDFTKAQHYLGLYRDGMSALKYYSRDYLNAKYQTNGWA